MSSRNSVDTGAGEKPQLPTNSVVTPWRILDSARRFPHSRQSECEWMSMKPGVTVSPATSRVRPAPSDARSPTASMRAPVMPTSARRGGAPVPSRTVPPAILRSNTGRFPEVEDGLAPCGGAEKARFREHPSHELHRERKTVPRDPARQRDGWHAGMAPRRAEVRVAGGVEPARRGPGSGGSEERVVAQGNGRHLFPEPAEMAPSGEEVHRPDALPHRQGLPDLGRILLGQPREVRRVISGGLG